MDDITLQKAPDKTLRCINGNITCKAKEVISPLISPVSGETLSYISVSSSVYCTAEMWINGEKRQERYKIDRQHILCGKTHYVGAFQFKEDRTSEGR